MEKLGQLKDFSAIEVVSKLGFDKKVSERLYESKFHENGVLHLELRSIYNTPEKQATLSVGLKDKGEAWQDNFKTFNASNYRELYDFINDSKEEWEKSAESRIFEMGKNYQSALKNVGLIKKYLNSNVLKNNLDQSGSVTFEMGSEKMIRIQFRRSDRFEIRVGNSIRKLITMGREEGGGTHWDENNFKEGLDLAKAHLQSL